MHVYWSVCVSMKWWIFYDDEATHSAHCNICCKVTDNTPYATTSMPCMTRRAKKEITRS